MTVSSRLSFVCFALLWGVDSYSFVFFQSYSNFIEMVNNEQNLKMLILQMLSAKYKWRLEMLQQAFTLYSLVTPHYYIV